MILGRSTVLWTALITAAASLAQVLAVTLIPDLDPVVVATIIGSVTGFLAVFISFLAKTATTPTHEPHLKVGTDVKVLDAAGHQTGDSVIIKTTPPGPTGHDNAGTNTPGVSG